MTHHMSAVATPPSSANLPQPPAGSPYKYGPRTAPLPRLADGRLVAGDATGHGDPMNSLDYLSTWTSTYLNEVSTSVWCTSVVYQRGVCRSAFDRGACTRVACCVLRVAGCGLRVAGRVGPSRRCAQVVLFVLCVVCHMLHVY